MIGSARLGSALLSRATRAALTTPRLFPPCPAGHARALTSTLSVADRARQAAVQRANARRRAANTSPSSPSKPLPPSLSLARGAPPAVTLRAAPGSLQPTTAVVPAARRSGRDLVLSPPALVVTREFEFGNILFGFEQANKYTIRAAPGGHVVGFIAEEDGLGKSVVRQVMKTHRKFTATVFDSAGSPVFELRRPAFLVSSNMYVHEPGPGGALLGHVEMAWHLWRRRYRLYTGGAQFAECDAGFLGIDFEMKNEGGGAVARVNKDFTGFAREMFTDARQYVIRLDPAYNMTGEGFDNVHATTLAAGQATGGDGGKDEVGLRERAVLVASAIGIDFDYFSVHSRGPGLMPFAMAGGGGGGGGAGGAAGGAAGSVGGAAGAEAAGGAMGEIGRAHV